VHGWGELQPELTNLSKRGEWDGMADLITDEILHTFSVVGTPEEVGKGLIAKISGTYTRTAFYDTWNADPSVWPLLLDATR
jgi:hypothetical protein